MQFEGKKDSIFSEPLTEKDVYEINLPLEKSIEEHLNVIKQNKESTKLEKIKETLIKWSQDTGFQAFPRIFQDELYFSIRLVWLIVFLSLSGITGYLCMQSILMYLQWGTVSTIEIVREVPTKFPSLTLCDSNPFTSLYAQTLLESLAFKEFNINISQMNSTQFNLYKENLTNYAKIVVNDPSFGDSNRKLLGFPSIVPILIQKRINLDDIRNDDFDKYFPWYWHADYGNCYQFNVATLNSSNGSSIRIYATDVQTGEGDYFGLFLR